MKSTFICPQQIHIFLLLKFTWIWPATRDRSITFGLKLHYRDYFQQQDMYSKATFKMQIDLHVID